MHMQSGGEVEAHGGLLLHSLGKPPFTLGNGVGRNPFARYGRWQTICGGHGLTSGPTGFLHPIDDIAGRCAVRGRIRRPIEFYAEIHVVGGRWGRARCAAPLFGHAAHRRVRSLVLLGNRSSFPPPDFGSNRQARPVCRFYPSNSWNRQFARWVSVATSHARPPMGSGAMLGRTDLKV